MSLNAGLIMTRKVITIGPDATVADVAQTMSQHRISGLPVLDAQGALLGMITESDVLRPLARSTTDRRDWWLSQLAEDADLASNFLDYLRADHRLARDLMTVPATTVSPETEIPDLAELFITHGIKCLPVLRDGAVVGVVSRADLVKALARTPHAATS